MREREQREEGGKEGMGGKGEGQEREKEGRERKGEDWNREGGKEEGRQWVRVHVLHVKVLSLSQALQAPSKAKRGSRTGQFCIA